MLRSDIDFDLKDFKQALADANKACASEPNSAGALNNRGRILDSVGEYQQALKDYDRAIVLEPTQSDHYFHRALVLMRLEKYQQAADDFTKNLAMPHADDIEASYMNRAKCYDKIGRHDLANRDRQKGKELTQSGWGAFMQSEQKKETP